MTTPALETRALVKHFGGLVATNNVSLSVAPGARHALIGPNGAGKTTLINLLTGILAPTAGHVFLNGEDIPRLSAHARARRGLMRTFQINQLFATLTPMETVLLVISQRDGQGARWWQRLGASSAQRDEAVDLLQHMHLGDVLHAKTAQLPYGKRRLLEIAIALAGKPRVLLLDEPVAGVPAGESQEILETIAALPANVTVLLIEHDMDLVFRFATSMSVLVNGALFAEGAPAEIARDERVRQVYLGQHDD